VTVAQVTAQVTLCGVTKVFPAAADGNPVHALGPINLEIRKGEFFAVVGPSGCGKSTLLELIAGLTAPTEGEIEFEGRAIGDNVPDGIGVVFQEDACFPWLNVLENVGFGLRRTTTDNDEKGRRAAAVIDMMGLRDFARSYPAQLSGGMRQRVCIARTIVAQPRLILLDEPFGALDQQTRHALDEAVMLADRIVVMSARPGRTIDLVETGWPRERDSRIVERENFGALTSRLWKTLREESLKTMGRAG
jgi:NitT/TauT family transport system ATP-binding protein